VDVCGDIYVSLLFIIASCAEYQYTLTISSCKVGRNAPELSFWPPQNRHLAFQLPGPHIYSFLVETLVFGCRNSVSEVLNPAIVSATIVYIYSADLHGYKYHFICTLFSMIINRQILSAIGAPTPRERTTFQSPFARV